MSALLSWPSASSATEIATTWSGTGDWFADPTLWSNGVANNSGGNTFAGTVATGTLNLAKDATVNSLTNGGNISVSGDGTTLSILGDFNNTGRYSSLSLQGGRTLDTRVVVEISGNFLNTASALLGFSSDAYVHVGKSFTNSGSLEVSNDASELHVDDSLSNSGYLDVSDGAAIDIKDDLHNSGWLTLHGIFSPEGSTIHVGGLLDTSNSLVLEKACVLTSDSGLLQQQDHVLTAGYYSLAESSKLAWSGADIRDIGTNATIYLVESAIIADSETGENALRNLAQNHGSLNLLSGATLQTSSSLSNSGELDLTYSGTSLTVRGDLQNSGDVSLYGGNNGICSLNVSGNISNSKSVEFSNADVHTGGDLTNTRSFTVEGLTTTTIDGVLFNSGSIDIHDTAQIAVAANLKNTGSILTWDAGASIHVSGALDNMGTINMWGTGNRLSVDGGLIQQQNDVLTSGIYYVSQGGVIEWSGASIHDIAKGAEIHLGGSGMILDSITHQNALANLTQNHGVLELSQGQVTNISGNFTNPGRLTVEDNQTSLTIEGALTTSNLLELDGSYAVTDVTNLAVTGAVQNSSTVLIRSSGGSARMHVGGDFTNSGSVSVVGYGTQNLTTLDVDGAFHNTGTISVSSLSKITVGGDFDNSGTIYVYSPMAELHLAGTLDNTGTISVSQDSQLLLGPLSQQQGTTLVAGTYTLQNNAKIGWNGADIQTVGTNARISLTGTATIIDSQTNANALNHLAENDGSLSVQAAAVLTIPGAFTNKGTFSISGKNTAVSVAQDLNNSSQISLDSGSTLTVAGALSNSGTISTSSNSVVSIAGGLAQQAGTVLTAGTYSLSGTSVIKWNQADIRTIGAAAGISLSGTANLQDQLSGQNALRNLSEVAGKLTVTGGAQLPIAGDLHLAGTLTLGSASALTVGGGLTMDPQARFTLTLNSASGMATAFMNIAGTADLNGTLRLTYTPAANPAPSAIFDLLDAESLIGTFANAPTDGSLISCYNSRGILIGSFTVDYSDTAVALRNFTAVPEPSVWALLSISGLVFLGRRWSRKSTLANR